MANAEPERDPEPSSPSVDPAGGPVGEGDARTRNGSAPPDECRPVPGPADSWAGEARGWSRSKRLLYASLPLLCLLAFWLKWEVHEPRRAVGHGDIAQYYTLAQNLQAGRGHVLDYVPMWLGEPERLQVSGVSYWMPFPSWVGASGLVATGETDFRSANLGALAWTSLLPLLIFLLGRVALGRPGPAWIGAALSVGFLPFLDRGAQITTHGPAAALSCLVLVGALLSLRDVRWLALAGVAAGLAHCNRSDAVFWLVSLGIFVLWQHGRRQAWKPLALVCATYLVGVAPALAASWSSQGTLLPSGQWRAALLTSYPELYSLPEMLTWDRYIGRGLDVVLAEKWNALLANLGKTPACVATGEGLRSWGQLEGASAWAWIVLCWTGVWFLPRRLLGLVGVQYLLVLLLYSLVFTYTGSTSWHPAQFLLYPVLLLGAGLLLDTTLLRWGRAPGARTPRRWLALGAVLAGIVWITTDTFVDARDKVAARAAYDVRVEAQQRAILAGLVQANGLADEAFFVAQNVTHTFHANTGLRVASLPFRASVDDVRRVAERLGIRHLLLDRRATRSPVWPELGAMLAGPHFHEAHTLEVAGREHVVWELVPVPERDAAPR